MAEGSLSAAEALHALLHHRYHKVPARAALSDAPEAVGTLLSASADRNICTEARSLVLDALANGLSATAHEKGALEVCLGLICEEGTPCNLLSSARRLLRATCGAAESQHRSSSIARLCTSLGEGDEGQTRLAARGLAGLAGQHVKAIAPHELSFLGSLSEVERDATALTALVNALRDATDGSLVADLAVAVGCIACAHTSDGDYSMLLDVGAHIALLTHLRGAGCSFAVVEALRFIAVDDRGQEALIAAQSLAPLRSVVGAADSDVRSIRSAAAVIGKIAMHPAGRAVVHSWAESAAGRSREG